MSGRNLATLYEVLSDLRERVGGFRRLRECTGRDGWPLRGVYFLLDEREVRGGGQGPRVVRVGTHGLRAGGKATLWGRLRQHRGTGGGGRPGGGNHRGSVFRFHVGAALLSRDGDPDGLLAQWMSRRVARTEVAPSEHETEVRVSEYIGELPFLWVDVPDEPGPLSERGLIERGAIAMLSSDGRDADPPSPGWLGHHAPSAAIPRSGLWNVSHVGESYDPAFLEILGQRVKEMG